MPASVTIAIDVMGGDIGPAVTIPGAAMALKARPNLKFLLYGDEHQIQTQLKSHAALSAACIIHHTDKVVGAHEKPGVALRAGRDSSMRLAINSVVEGRAEAVVSGGNTGALMAMAKLAMRTLPDIHRPAIASVLPTEKGEVVMLDLGANLECDEEILVQFALMGSVYARVVRNIQNPTVGLLNVGSEDMKGHENLRAAAAILQQVKFHGKYHGFVEGNDITAGTVDVVVTDGFTGNIALKVAEGVGKLTSHILKDSLKSSFLSMIGGMLAMGALQKVKKRLDPRLYNGGMFLGLDGICVKSHGSMDALGFCNAIFVAADLAANGFNKRVAEEIAAVMSQESFVARITETKTS